MGNYERIIETNHFFEFLSYLTITAIVHYTSFAAYYNVITDAK